jgi:uncharacterized protein YdaU (DUF1376 family)
MNYFPFHIGDYASATRHLSWEEDAAYRRMLDVYYTTEKPLPADVRSVCRLVVATTESQREAVKIVLEEFFDLTEIGWGNSRADETLAVMKDRQEKQREKANKRWSMPRPKSGNAAAMPQHQDNDAVASKDDAVAMPPIPIPIPIEKNKRKSQDPPPDGGMDSGPPSIGPEDPIKAIFDQGVAILTASGKSEQGARSLIGRLRKTVGDEDFARILVASRSKTDPAAYMAKAAQPKVKAVSL